MFSRQISPGLNVLKIKVGSTMDSPWTDFFKSSESMDSSFGEGCEVVKFKIECLEQYNGHRVSTDIAIVFEPQREYYTL